MMLMRRARGSYDGRKATGAGLIEGSEREKYAYPWNRRAFRESTDKLLSTLREAKKAKEREV